MPVRLWSNLDADPSSRGAIDETIFSWPYGAPPADEKGGGQRRLAPADGKARARPAVAGCCDPMNNLDRLVPTAPLPVALEHAQHHLDRGTGPGPSARP